MKINKSTIQFNCSTKKTPSGERCTLQNVPYWKLYSRKGDCIGEGWFSTRSLTYQEIVNYLQRFNGHRVLEAYPRFSTKTRRSYNQYYDKVNDEFSVEDKVTGEQLYIADAKTGKKVYLSPDYKSDYHFFRMFFRKRHGEYPNNYTGIAHCVLTFHSRY